MTPASTTPAVLLVSDDNLTPDIGRQVQLGIDNYPPGIDGQLLQIKTEATGLSQLLREASHALAAEAAEPQLLNIVQYPDPILSRVSEPVTGDIKSDKPLQQLLSSMVRTMRQARGVGLAAVQVGVPLRVLVVQTPEMKEPVKVINPRILTQSTVTESSKEGCLSFLGVYVNVKRPVHAIIEYFDEEGDKQTVQGTDLLGRAILHEIDHLDGKTFLDRLSKVERSMALDKVKVAKRKVNALVRKFSAQSNLG